MAKKKNTIKKPEILGPDGKPFRKSKSWIRPQLLKISIVGVPKIGKSSFAWALGEVGVDGFDPFFLPTQPGLEGLEVNCPVIDCPECQGKGCDDCEDGRAREIISNYDRMLFWTNWCIQTPFNPIIIDPIAPLHEYCVKKIEEVGGMTIEEAKPQLRRMLWYNARVYLQRIVGDIIASGKGLIVISHLYWREVTIPAGDQTITKSVPETNLGGKSAEYINQIIDVEMHFDSEYDQDANPHWIARVKPGPTNLGGDRTGYLPEKFDRGNSAEEAAKNFLSFFYDL